MIQTLIGKKIEQTQGFLSDGTRIPLTVIAVPKANVTQVKTIEKDGYAAVQIGIGSKKKPSKPLLGHSKKANLQSTPSHIREVKVTPDTGTIPQLGDELNASDVFKSGDIIKVSGTAKGKGFAGGVKRYGFRGGPRTHGQSDRERAPGSIGQTTTPGRVYKGKRMAGHMGTHTVSITNLVVVSVSNDTMLVKGLVPGVINGTLYIEKTGESKKPVELYESPEDKAVREAKEQEASKAQEEASANDSSTQNEETVEVSADSADAPKEVKSEEGDVVPAEATAPKVNEQNEEKVKEASADEKGDAK